MILFYRAGLLTVNQTIFSQQYQNSRYMHKIKQ